MPTPPPVPSQTTSPELPVLHIRRGTEKLGPYGLETAAAMRNDGRLLPTDLAWTNGMVAWEALDGVLKRFGRAPSQKTSSAMSAVIPVNCTGLSIAAGYAGLFALLIITAPIALVLGILALRDLNARPGKSGRGRAWFGTIMGALGTLALIFLFTFPFLSAVLSR